MTKFFIGTFIAIQLVISLSGCCCNCAKKPVSEQSQNQQNQDPELVEQSQENQ